MRLFRCYIHLHTIGTSKSHIKKEWKTMYAFSFFGKVCLLLMIRWIAKQKRFLFFLVQKANCMSESSFMLRDFYKIYEGYPDKEREN